MIDHKAIL